MSDQDYFVPGIDQLDAVVKYMNQWRGLDVSLSGRGSAKLPDGGYRIVLEYTLEADIPNSAAVEELQALAQGRLSKPSERNPTAEGQQLSALDVIDAFGITASELTGLGADEDEAVEPATLGVGETSGDGEGGSGDAQ